MRPIRKKLSFVLTGLACVLPILLTAETAASLVIRPSPRRTKNLTLFETDQQRDSSARALRRNDKSNWLLSTSFAGWAAAVSPQSAMKPCGTVTVAAASDLTYAMREIAANFARETGCTARVSLGSSGNFLTQIENGAPFDVFFSADIEYPKKLEEEGLAVPGSTYLYAVGKIVLWTRNDSHLDVGKGLAELRNPAIQKIAIANPQHAPYGRAAEEALRQSGVYDAVRDRLVLGENISQAAEFVESGNADAGILALSLVLSPAMKGKGRLWIIPENLYTPIQQGAVVLRMAPNPQGARLFLDAIKMSETAALLERYGFALPGKVKP